MEIYQIVILVIAIIASIVSIVSSIRSGEMKKFIAEKMQEAEATNFTGEEKLNYVIQEVKKKYKLLTVFTNIKKVVEMLIDFSKNVNHHS